MSLFMQRRSSVVAPILTGIGGLLLGAGIVSLFTPRTGPQLRSMVKDLWLRSTHREPVDREMERMEGEGGVSHVVTPPLSGRTQTHS
jgi:hypothetical protein